MTKDKLKALLQKECPDYSETLGFNQITGTLSDGTKISVIFKDLEVIKREEPTYTGFDAKLKTALNYNPKKDKDK